MRGNMSNSNDGVGVDHFGGMLPKTAEAVQDEMLMGKLVSTAVWTVAPMIIHVKRVTMHSYPG